MIKVFLVEDETIVREGLKNNIPWQQYGFEFVGEASDGEMALPMIQKEKPDVLLTDIKMPFMDGLTLSKIVHQEFPDMKIIIISGHDDFEYAQEAISVGVDQYLLKPITRLKMQKVLSDLKAKIDKEREQKNYQEQFLDESPEYDQYARIEFFSKLFEGHTSLQEIYEQASKLSIRIQAPCYNLLLFCLQEKRDRSDIEWNSEEFTFKKEELLHSFLRYPEYLVFRVNMNTYGVLLKGSVEAIPEMTQRCVSSVSRICEPTQDKIEWYLAVGEPVERISLLPQCYENVNHSFTYRFILPNEHVLTSQLIEKNATVEDTNKLKDIDSSSLDPGLIKDFLSKASLDEVEAFVRGYIASIGDATSSKMFQNYLLFHVRFTTIAYVEAIGCKKQDYLDRIDDMQSLDYMMSDEELYQRISQMLKKAMLLRDAESEHQGKRMLKKALTYIDENFTNESLTLNEVASFVNVSANYFSAIFSRQMEETFVEYLTQKRMEKAKKLLLETELHTSEVATQIGYKDSHYFSFVFKKTQGVTPREYRSGVKA